MIYTTTPTTHSAPVRTPKEGDVYEGCRIGNRYTLCSGPDDDGRCLSVSVSPSGKRTHVAIDPTASSYKYVEPRPEFVLPRAGGNFVAAGSQGHCFFHDERSQRKKDRIILDLSDPSLPWVYADTGSLVPDEAKGL